MEIAAATPVEIDTELARIWEAQQKVMQHIASLQRALADWDRRGKGKDSERPHVQYSDFAKRADDHRAELAGLKAEARPFEAEFARRPWSRFFLVTNQNGHIHTSMNCSTCFHDTQFGWMPQYSGMSDAEIVAVEAYRCCTVCMPIAPAQQKAARERYSQQQREQRQAEQDARKAEKGAKARVRAVKLVDKVEAAIEKLGGREVFKTDYSLHGHDGRKSIYEWSFDNCQSTVGDVLYEIKEREERGNSHHRMNEYVRTELQTRGLA